MLFEIGFGQDTQNTKNTADQSSRSAGRVNPSTLGMEFNLPMGSYAGRGINLPLGLNYSSKVWQFQDYFTVPGHNNSPPTRIYTWGLYSMDSAAGWTSSLAQPYIEYTGSFNRFNVYGRPLPGPNTVATPLGNWYVPRVTVFLPGGNRMSYVLLRPSLRPMPRSIWARMGLPIPAYLKAFF